MREIGRGGSSSGKERGAGVTVAAAVAILERQQEEQRRTAPPVRHRLRGDLNRITEAGISRDSSDSSVSSVGETIARLQNRFSADVVAGNVVSSADKELKQHTDAKSVKHVTRPNRNEFISGRTKEPDNSDVKTKRVVTERERGVHEIRKSPSTKNISSLVRNNSVVSTLNTEALSPLDSKTQDVRKCVGDGTHGGVSDLSLSDGTQFIVSENTSSSEQTYRSELSASNTGSDPSNLQSSSSAKDVLDHHDDSDDEGIGAASLRSDTLDQPQITLKGFPSDDNIPRKRPRIIHLRDTGSKDKRPKSNTVAASRTDRQQAQSVGEAGLLSSNSSVNIVLEYPPPPPSLPPEYGSCGRPLSGGTSASNSRWILASTDSLASPTFHNDQRTQASPVHADDDDDDDSGTCSTSSGSGSGTEDVHVVNDDSPFIVNVGKRHLVGVPEEGGDESSPDEEEEDSTLKCSGTAWSGSDSAPRHRSSSTSDFSSSSSSEEEAEDHNRPSHKPCQPTEDLTTTGCDDDFQWVCSSAGVTDRRRQLVKKSNVATAEKRVIDICTPESDGGRYSHQELDYDPPQIMQSQNIMTPSYEKETDKSEVQTCGADGCAYRQLVSESSEAPHRKPPRHDSGLKSHASFDKASSLDRRRYRGHNRANRDQKSQSSIVLHSPRFRSPARHASPSGVECPHYSNTSCCNEAAKILMNHGVSCCDTATSLLHCSSSHECIHQPLHSSLYNDPTHCCSATSVREDIMSSSFDSAFSENRRHHHHQGDLQYYGSAGKLDCHSRICHGLGSQQDLLLHGECCSMLPQGGDCFGSHGYLPLCSCQAEQRCRRRLMCKHPSVNSDVEERLRRLEADKDSLQLQVTVLTEQIEVQTDKISDLEKLLDEKKRQLANAEDMLQRASGTFL